MEQNIAAAVKLYSGDKPLGLFVDKLDKNLQAMNDVFEQIKDVFVQAQAADFAHLPEEMTLRKNLPSCSSSLTTIWKLRMSKVLLGIIRPMNSSRMKLMNRMLSA